MKRSRWGTCLSPAALFLSGVWFEVVAFDALLLKVDSDGSEVWLRTLWEA